jgi:hypothetical protein
MRSGGLRPVRSGGLRPVRCGSGLLRPVVLRGSVLREEALLLLPASSLLCGAGLRSMRSGGLRPVRSGGLRPVRSGRLRPVRCGPVVLRSVVLRGPVL